MKKYNIPTNLVPPVIAGERLIVMGRHEKAIVKDLIWIPEEGRWKIFLDWGVWGSSHVWCTDESKIWSRYSETN